MYIIPFIKLINNVQLVLWDRIDTPYHVERTCLYEVFTTYSEDYAVYTPVRFESL